MSLNSLNYLKLLILILFCVDGTTQLGIECKFDDNRDYSCMVNKIWNVDEPIVTFMIGENKYGKNRVSEVRFEEKDKFYELKYFPRELIKFFPNVQSIVIHSENNITEISAEDLRSYADLESLRLRNSKITSIPGDLFKYNEKMRFILVTRNKFLTSVGENLLENLKQLKFVAFHDNKCINRIYGTPNTFKYLRNEFIKHCPPIIEQNFTVNSNLSAVLDEDESTKHQNETENL